MQILQFKKSREEKKKKRKKHSSELHSLDFKGGSEIWLYGESSLYSDCQKEREMAIKVVDGFVFLSLLGKQKKKII